MEETPNGRVTIREVYNLLREMEERLTERLDRLDEKVEKRCDKNDNEIHLVEARINRQDWFVTGVAAIAAAIAAAIGWQK